MKIKCTASVGRCAVDDVIEIDDEDLEEMNEEEKDTYITNLVFEHMVQRVNFDWDVIDK